MDSHINGVGALKDRLRELLTQNSEFSQLTDVVLQDLVDGLKFKYVPGGHQIAKEGEPSDSLFILVSGRLRMSRRNENNKLLLFNEIFPGECIGETGMAIEQPYTVDIFAIRDSIIANLTKANFEALLVRHPISINRIFTQAIFNQSHHIRQSREHRLSQTLAVVPLHPDVDAKSIAIGLSETLKKSGQTCYLSAEWGRARVSAVNGSPNQPDLQFDKDRLEAENEFLVYEAEAGISQWTLHVCRQADQILFAANADKPPDQVEIEKALAFDPGFAFVRKHLLLIHTKRSRCVDNMVRWKSETDVERVYPVCLDSQSDFSRLARFLTSSAVGLVLGGGGARGFAHLGVLRALEESGVPVDLIGGNSMGALIGALYAYGVPRAEIHELILKYTRKGARLNLPFLSLLSSAPFENQLRHFFGDTLIESLWLPFFATACNLSKANTAVLDHGLLWKAVLASNSPAGLLPPVVHRGDLLVDGGILENVPVSAMRSRLGVELERRRGNGTVIAVDVDIRGDLAAPPELDKIKPLDVVKARLSRSSPSVPGMVDILLQAGHIGGMAQRAKTIAMADLYLEPPVRGYSLMKYKNAAEIIEIGYRYATEQVARWNGMS
jgi:predicted acylesterase/phospholipase RssA/CRP-like cAMP-binding protein